MLPAVLERLTCADFQRHLNEEFTVEVDGTGPMPMELVQATESDLNPRVKAGRQPFSLIFVGPRTTVLPQHIYRMKHPEMGELDVFIVPIAQDGNGTRYEAVFT